MALPINIDQLLAGRTIEWERLEFKKGWNPQDILHTICAFANDINNWGGGYIVIGIEEENGRPVLPPHGLDEKEIDQIQRKLIELCHRITPNYFPLVLPTKYMDKSILILWVPGGDTRPYKVPEKLTGQSRPAYYIRRYSATVKASHQEEVRLMQLTAKIPFDDRVNHHATIENLNITLIKSFLKEVGSGLFESAESYSFAELCRQIQIVRGANEYLKPLNVGLLFFSLEPHLFFKGARIEIVQYFDDSGDRFHEEIFTGPLHDQFRSALRYIKNNVIQERVEKVPGKAEADRFFNYPYESVEEALANAVYHRSYEDLNPIEVNVRPDCLEIISFPGPLPPVDNEALKKERVIVRDYRNRRIGDFLKELDLTEGRSTGILKIRRQLKRNGSPPPVFKTDDQLTYFLTIIHKHPRFPANKNESENETLNDTINEPLNETKTANSIEGKILREIGRDEYITYEQLAQSLNKARSTIYRNIKKLTDKNIIKRVGSKKKGYWEIIRQ